LCPLFWEEKPLLLKRGTGDDLGVLALLQEGGIWDLARIFLAPILYRESSKNISRRRQDGAKLHPRGPEHHSSSSLYIPLCKTLEAAMFQQCHQRDIHRLLHTWKREHRRHPSMMASMEPVTMITQCQNK
jgi:hypothetical protein